MGFSDLWGAERRTHPANPDKWLLELAGAGSSYTGKSISEEESLESTAVWSAVTILSQTIAALSLILYKRLDKGKKRADKALSDLYHLMHTQPNPEMTSMIFRETGMGQLLLYGNWYSEKQFDGNMNVTSLWPLLSRDMEPRRLENGKLIYRYKLPNTGREVLFPRERILHIPAFSSNGLIGHSPVKKGKEAIALNLALEEYGARFFAAGGAPPVVIEYPMSLGKEAKDRIKESWQDKHGGLENAHRVAILEEGMKIHEYGIDPEKAQAIETRKFGVNEVARIFNVPPHFLKDLERATYSNVEEQSRNFVSYTLQPWLVKLEQCYTTQLLTKKQWQNQGYFFEHLVDTLLRADTEKRWEAHKNGFMTGSLSPNDILEMENRNPSDNPMADERFVPMNMIPLSMIGKTGPKISPIQNPEEEGQENYEVRVKLPVQIARLWQAIDNIKKSHHGLFFDAASRIVKKETKAVDRAIENHFTKRKLEDFNAWIDDFYGGLGNYVRQNFIPVDEAFGIQVYSELDNLVAEPFLTETGQSAKFIEDYVNNFAHHYTSSSIGQIRGLIKDTKPEEIVDVLRGRINEWGEKRALKIADQETKRLSNAIANDAYIQIGVKNKRWHTRGKSCPFCKSLDGKIVGVEKAFTDSDNKLSAGGNWITYSSPRYHAPLHRGCDCVIVPEF